MPEDTLLVEILTAANLAGIEQADAGLLGMAPNLAAVTLGFGVLAIAGKSVIDIYEGHEKALGRLKQASDAVGQSYTVNKQEIEDYIKVNQQFIPDNNKAIDTFALLLRSTGNYSTALRGLGEVMNLAAISPTKDWDTATQAINLGLQGTGRRLRDLGIDISALTNAPNTFTATTK